MSKLEQNVFVHELRFKKEDGTSFPDWKPKRLKSLATRRTEKNKGGNVTRVLTNSAVGGILDQRDYFEKDIATKGNLQGYYIVGEGDFVYNPRVSIAAPVGPISKNKVGEGVMSPLYTVFSFNCDNSDFYEQYFKSSKWHRYLQSVSNTGARHDRMSIASDDFWAMPIPTPDEREQQKIADFLSSTDKLIAIHSKKLEALEFYKKGLMQQLFPVEGGTVPNLRFPEFKNEAGWIEYSIEALIDEGVILQPKDGNHGNIHPKSSDYVNVGIPFIMASDIQYGKIDLIGCSKISKSQADKLQKGFAQEGDVLLTHKGTVGEVAIVNKIEYPYLMLTPQVTYYRIVDKDKLSNRFLEYSFTSEHFQKKLAIASGGGTRSYIGIVEQRKLVVILPTSLDEQQKIVEFLSSIDEIVTAQRFKISALKSYKKGLMQRVFPDITEVEV